MAADITPTALKARMDAGEKITIVDVREEWELDEATFEGALHIPMDDIPDSLDRIPRDHTVVLMCHAGSRSTAIARWLAARGLPNVLNLVGGIDAWSREVDPSVPTY